MFAWPLLKYTMKLQDSPASVRTGQLLWSTGYQLLLLMREPVGLVFGAIFSIAIVPILAVLYGDFETVVSGVYHKNVIVWDAIGINLAASAFVTIPTNFAAQRSYGLLKLYRASPLSRAHLVLSFLFANLLFFFAVRTVAAGDQRHLVRDLFPDQSG